MGLKKQFAEMIGTGNAFRLKYQYRPVQPDSIRIDICAVCNAACPFCPRVYMPDERKKGFMSFDYYKRLLEEAREMGIGKLKLYITSEPSLHPDFEAMIDHGKAMGFKLYISTNAFTLHRHIETLKKIDFIQFSIEGWDKESYEKFRTPLKFDRVFENMENYLKEARGIEQSTSIHLPLSKKTDLEKFMLLWGHLVDQVRIDFLQPANIYSQGAMDAGMSNLLAEDYYDFQRIEKDFVCFDPFEEITVGYDGKILLCCLDFSGNYDLGHADQGLKNIHENDAIKNVRNQFYSQKLDICRDCSLFYRPSPEAIEAVQKQIEDFESRHNVRAKIIFKG
jgi:radical SAM protein with 4Fe4S-binding SPASM domain